MHPVSTTTNIDNTVRQTYGQFAKYGQDPCNGVDDDCDGIIDKGCPGARPAPMVVVKPVVGLANTYYTYNGAPQDTGREEEVSVQNTGVTEEVGTAETATLLAPQLHEEPLLATVLDGQP